MDSDIACGFTCCGYDRVRAEGRELPRGRPDQPGAAYETLAEATYPEMAKYPDETAYMKKDGSFDDEGFSKVYDAWWADKRARRDIDIDRENVQSFVRASTGAMLESGNGGNFVYSPLNVYMALSMLAECTDGDSRTQILSLLRENSLEDVRAQARRFGTQITAQMAR